MSRTFTIVRYGDLQYSNKAKLEQSVVEDSGEDSQKHVRRPLNGLRPNKNYYATIMSPNGMLNSSYIDSKKLTNFNNNFLIQSMTFSRDEKMQVIETFGENYVYFFGNRSPVANFRGMLLNSQTFEWFAEFDTNYVNSFRGTRSAARNKEISITVDGVIYYGHIHNVSYDLNSEQPSSLGVSFSMHVARVQHLTDPTVIKNKSKPISEILNDQSNTLLNSLVLGASTESSVTRKFSSLSEELAFYASQSATINIENEARANGTLIPKVSKTDPIYGNGYRSLFPDEYVNHVSGKSYDDLFDTLNSIADKQFLDQEYVNSKDAKNLNVLIYEDARRRGSIGTLEPKVYVSLEQRQEMATREEDVRNKASGYLDAHVNDSSIFDGLNVKLKQTLTVAAGLALYKGLEAANNLFGRSAQKILDQFNAKADAAIGVLR
jgi:hypothetical protein